LDKAAISEIVARAGAGTPPSLEEAEAIVSLKPGPAAEALFSGASKLRDEAGGSLVFLYGFVYLSTYCRNNCAFCHYRSELAGLSRYRKSLEEIVAAAEALKEGGVHLIDLTMGEDEGLIRGRGFEELLEIVRAVRQKTRLPVMLSPGRLSAEKLRKAKEAGADWYALYQETSNRELFKLWRRGQDFDSRLKAKREAIEAGLLVEDGMLLGAGAAPKDLAESISAFRSLPASQVRAMTYVPSPGGLPKDPAGHGSFQELLAIAALRLSQPLALIPASLDVEGLSGLAPRMRAGANVVTSIIEAGSKLAGVASKDLDIENRRRGAEMAKKELERLSLAAASQEDYLEKLRSLKAQAGARIEGPQKSAPETWPLSELKAPRAAKLSKESSQAERPQALGQMRAPK
jgi:methylornithine synthase